MKNSTSEMIPVGRQRWSAQLHYDDYSLTVLGEPPVQHVRLQLRGMVTVSALDRIVMLFVLAQLRDARRDLHWSDVEREWRAHCVARGRRPMPADEFWRHLLPAMWAGVLVCTWDRSEVAA